MTMAEQVEMTCAQLAERTSYEVGFDWELMGYYMTDGEHGVYLGDFEAEPEELAHCADAFAGVFNNWNY